MVSFSSYLILAACANEPRQEAGSATLVDPAVAAESRPQYDPATEIEVSGSVARVREVPRSRGSVGVHVDLEVGAASYDVHLGPKFFLDEIGFVPNVNDALHVVGSQRSGTPIVLIAREVTRDGKTWTFRDPSGRPLWRGGRP
jgi:hypothetical protein